MRFNAGFMVRDVAKLVDLPVTVIRSRVDRGYISPGERLAEGPGTRNLFSFVNLVELAVMQQLCAWGVTIEGTRPFLQVVRETAHLEDLGTDEVIVSKRPGTVERWCLARPLEPAECLVIVGLGCIVRELRRRINGGVGGSERTGSAESDTGSA